MEKILENYSDVGTCGTIVYCKPAMDALYEDREYTKKLSSDACLELFLKGMVVSMTGNLDAGDDGPRQLAKPTRAYFSPDGRLVAIYVMGSDAGDGVEMSIAMPY
jgi:hypothetical protein